MNTAEGLAGYVVLSGTVEKEEDQYAFYCRELGTSSCGDRADDALENLGDAIAVHLDALAATGELSRYLRERNIRIDLEPPPDELSIRVAPGKIFQAYYQRVPVAGTA
jgi:predicted RNase H-like HicB family nuclease